MSTDFSLSEEDHKKILYNCYKNPYIKYKRAELLPLAKNVEGITGDHYKLKIFYQLDNIELHESFFVKTSIMKHNPGGRELFRNAYKKEIFIYNFLLKEFDKMGLDTSFSPKCYLCKDDEVLVLEDIAQKGFKLTDRIKFLDLEHLKSSLESLATYHGCSFLYELEKSKELNRTYRLIEDRKDVFEEHVYSKKYPLSFKWIELSVDLWIRLVDELLPEDENKEEFKKRLREKELREVFHEDIGYRKICGHGDLWSNNLMFKRLNTKKLKQNLIDYQIIRYSYPSYDVFLLLYFNASKSDRDKHMEELIQHYFNTLSNVLDKKGYKVEDVLPFKEFKETIKLIKYQALLQAVSCFTITLLPTDLLNEMNSIFHKFMFADRYDFIKKAMDTDKKYTQMLKDCLLELKEVLFE